MFADDELTFDAEEFSGRVRLFPLPNLVMFPHVIQPLHIFEPRYRSLMDDALAGDKLIAMALLAVDDEPDPAGRPTIFPTCCLGRVVTHRRLADGRYNLLLAGLRRVRLVRELEVARPYREAEVQLCEDRYGPEGEERREALRRRLLKRFHRTAPQLQTPGEKIEELLGDRFSLGALTDIIGYMTNLKLLLKQRLLEETDVDRRAEMLLEALTPTGGLFDTPPPGRKFPPDFSEN